MVFPANWKGAVIADTNSLPYFIVSAVPPPPVDLFGVTFTMQRHSPGHVFVSLEEPDKTTSLLINKQSDPIEVARSILQMVASHNLMRVTIDEGV